LFNIVLQLTAVCQIEAARVENWSDGFVELLTRATNFPNLQLLEDELAQRQRQIALMFSDFIK